MSQKLNTVYIISNIATWTHLKVDMRCVLHSYIYIIIIIQWCILILKYIFQHAKLQKRNKKDRKDCQSNTHILYCPMWQGITPHTLYVSDKCYISAVIWGQRTYQNGIPCEHTFNTPILSQFLYLWSQRDKKNVTHSVTHRCSFKTERCQLFLLIAVLLGKALFTYMRAMCVVRVRNEVCPNWE